jgi:hypothetical protein
VSLFDWAPFRKVKVAAKLHTLFYLRGAFPAFIHISDGKMHEVNGFDATQHYTENLRRVRFKDVESEKTSLYKRLRRHQMATFFVKLEPCTIGMEACTSAHFWARKLFAMRYFRICRIS